MGEAKRRKLLLGENYGKPKSHFKSTLVDQAVKKSKITFREFAEFINRVFKMQGEGCFVLIINTKLREIDIDLIPKREFLEMFNNNDGSISSRLIADYITERFEPSKGLPILAMFTHEEMSSFSILELDSFNHLNITQMSNDHNPDEIDNLLMQAINPDTEYSLHQAQSRWLYLKY